MKNITSIFLIIASLGIFFGYAKPHFAAVNDRKDELTKYEETLDKAKELDAKIATLKEKIKSMDPKDKARIEKLIPNNINNVNLAIDIVDIAKTAGLSIRNIDFDDNAKGEAEEKSTSKTDGPYNAISVSFVVSATYPAFVSFLDASEKSLRLFDVTGISFTPGDQSTYDFKVTLRTYWLK